MHIQKSAFLNSATFALVNLVTIVAVIGILDASLYLDPLYYTSQLVGQDLVTLLVVVPILFVSSVLAFNRNSDKSKLILGGIYLYLCYSYVFYCVPSTVNYLFFIYVGIVSISFYSLLMLYSHIKENFTAITLENKSIRVLISIYLIVIAVFISLIWIIDSYGFITAGRQVFQTPSGEPINTVYVLDLAFILPLCIYSGVKLIQQNFQGYVLSGILLVKTTLLGFALVGMTLGMARFGLVVEHFLLIVWVFIALAGLGLSYFYFSRISITSKES